MKKLFYLLTFVGALFIMAMTTSCEKQQYAWVNVVEVMELECENPAIEPITLENQIASYRPYEEDADTYVIQYTVEPVPIEDYSYQGELWNGTIETVVRVYPAIRHASDYKRDKQSPY